MKSRPILFSAPMVLALLSGAKTQTRRPIKPQPVPLRGHENRVAWGMADWQPPAALVPMCPYGHAGDRLYVRETWRVVGDDGATDDLAPSALVTDRSLIWYDADGVPAPEAMPGKTRVSIHMPRWASRIELEITDVRVQLLQDISAEDAIAEGIEPIDPPGWSGAGRRWRNYGMHLSAYLDSFQRPESSFRSLWESIHGPAAWEANPWCWALTFRRITP